MDAALLIWKRAGDEGEIVALLSPSIAESGEIRREHIRLVTLRLYVDRYGNPAIWAVNRPADGRRQPWAETAQEAAQAGEDSWVKVIWAGQAYDVEIAPLFFYI